jgi:hypothetical protein
VGKGHVKEPKLLNCAHCGTEFLGKHYKSRFCSKECNIKYTGTRYKLIGRNRDAALLNRYGITLDEFVALETKQNKECAICHEVPKKLYVDHCHETGQVRGLLCMKCNAALGLFKDKQTNLVNALTYLQEQLKKVRG